MGQLCSVCQNKMKLLILLATLSYWLSNTGLTLSDIKVLTGGPHMSLVTSLQRVDASLARPSDFGETQVDSDESAEPFQIRSRRSPKNKPKEKKSRKKSKEKSPGKRSPRKKNQRKKNQRKK